MVEHPAVNGQVEGSSPSQGANTFTCSLMVWTDLVRSLAAGPQFRAPSLRVEVMVRFHPHEPTEFEHDCLSG